MTVQQQINRLNDLMLFACHKNYRVVHLPSGRMVSWSTLGAIRSRLIRNQTKESAHEKAASE